MARQLPARYLDAPDVATRSHHAALAARCTAASARPRSRITARACQTSKTKSGPSPASSRYHPVVFAVSGGVPSIGVPVDAYTTTKLTGALGNFGQTSLLPAPSLLNGDGGDLFFDVWQARALIRERGLAEAAAQRAATAAWWDRVARAGESR